MYARLAEDRVKQVDFDGHERDFVFDDLNRETTEKWMNGTTVLNTISTAYNADGQVTSTGDSFSDYAFGNRVSVHGFSLLSR